MSQDRLTAQRVKQELRTGSLAPEYGRARSMATAGAVLLPFGAVTALYSGFAGGVAYEQSVRRAAFSVAGAGAVVAITGTILLATGIDRKRNLKAKAARKVALGVGGTRQAATFSLSGRF